MSRTCTALLLFRALAASLGFNLDTERVTRFHVDSPGFGHSVVQYANSRVVVGAPKEIKAVNQMGGLYECHYHTGGCEPVSLTVPPEAVNMSLGLSLAAATNPSQLLACGPTVHQACRQNIYLMGLCFLLVSPAQGYKKLPDALQECPRQDQDIVFLIDGSGSISSSDFAKMITFVRSVMSQFPRPRTQFSLMQFSHQFRTHFTFKDFTSRSDPLRLLDSVRQLRGLTYTASAIREVMKQLFTAQSGSRRDATKILIVITDGHKEGDRLDYEDVIPEAEAAGIIRYAIGVGAAFQTTANRQELNQIASSSSYIFKVENFDALRAIQNQLKEKIFAIEGTEVVSSSSFELEMSQEGFSAVFTPDGPVLGAVGSFSWSGGAFLYPPNGSPTFINMSQERMDMRDSYLGYAAELALWKGVQSLVLGAPRHQHTGKVLIFIRASGQWTPQAEVAGTQIGSYFGASLCSVDVDGDGSTDLVLIGAPHYYEPTRGGRVSVCPLPKGRARWRCDAVLQGEPGHPWGRFGAAMTALGDVNGDQLADVAIGAPGEQENRGAVYVFHGVSVVSIRSSHSQRITGSQLSPTLQYFGQSLSGGQDLTMDGLMDLAVGAEGHLFLLRSQPLLRVEATMTFKPREVPRNVFQCQEQGVRSKTAGVVTVCLRVRKTTRDRLREDVQAAVSYVLALDSQSHSHPRTIFDETNSTTYRQRQTLGLTQKCKTLTLLLPKCVTASVTPIVLRLNYTLVGIPVSSFGNLRPVLAEDAPKFFTASFPFEKNCGNDNICQDDLSVTFNFTNLHTLVVGDSRGLNVTVTVRNEGEDSYSTQVTLYHPAGLSYRIWSVVQNQRSRRSWSVSCLSGSSTQGPGALRSTSCNINHPIFPDNSEVTFIVIFDVDFGASLGNKLLLKANVTSENNMPRTNKTEFQLELPVKYAVYLIVTSGDDSTKYLNFTASETSRIIEHKYQFSNLGKRNLPISVVFWVPVGLNEEVVWERPQVTFSPNLSSACNTEERPPPPADFLAKLKTTGVLNCSIAVCQRIECDIPYFSVEEEFRATVHGNLSSNWYIKTSSNHILVVSTAEILFNDSNFALLPGREVFVRSQTETKVELSEVYNPLPLIVGSSIGGLVLLALITAGLYKLGFFKRQYKDMMSEAGPQEAPPQ